MTDVTDNRREKRPVISLFSGAMGLDLGLESAGLDIAVALERSKNPVATIRRNRPDLPLIDRPIEDVSSEEILDMAGLKSGEAFAVVGGPSCQVFSTAGQRKSLGDPRSTMFRHFVRVIRDTRPQFFVMENVRGLLSAAVRHRPLNERGPGFPALSEEEQLGSAFAVVARTLRKLGYYCVFDVLNAADFGVPQSRQRLVILGSRDGHRLQMPSATHSHNGASGLLPWQTLGQALEGLNDDPADYYRFCPAKERYLKLVPEGGNWRRLPKDLQREALGSAHDSWGGRSGFFRRLSFSEPSPALTTRPDSKATTLCHPTELRPLSVAEYARIQQFPDDWTFEGSVRKKYEQVGNAVPVGLGAVVGQALLAAASSYPRPERLGRFESFNLDLLAKLTRRPKTIVNPPRMRKDNADNSLSDWYGAAPRLRDDALEYVPRELQEEFQGILADDRRKKPRHGSAPSYGENAPSPCEVGDSDFERDVPLAAAE